MRVSKEQFQQNRQKILKAAGRLFREKGYEAVGVADVMKAAGLTHGGFYGHFKSKEDLFHQAADCVSGESVLKLWKGLVEKGGPDGMKAIADFYLGAEHCSDPGAGCLIATLGPEIARQPGESRGRVTENVKKTADFLTGLAPGATPEERRRHALASYAGWIGAVVLARLSEDEAFSKEVLAAAADA